MKLLRPQNQSITSYLPSCGLQPTSHPSRRQTLASLKAYLAARLDALNAAARLEARAARRQLLRVSEQLAALEAEVRADISCVDKIVYMTLFGSICKCV
jgi:hypothetical protein